MHSHARARLLLPFAFLFALPSAVAAPAGKFEIVKVAEGVYATIRKEPPGLWFDPNNVFIINDEDVVVVDANITSASTREVVAALRKLTTKPVRYVVNTHWHEDHVIGNRVWREAYPQVEFVGHQTTLRDLPTVGAANRKGAIENGPGLAKLLRELLAKNRNLGGAEMTAEERAGYATTAGIMEGYLAEAPDFRIILPTLAVADRLTLHRGGGRVIDIRHLGGGHTAADLVVHLPQENILVAGDLVVWPVPLVGSTSYPAAYAATLERLLALRPAVIIPGHGPVMRDDSHARLTLRLLNSIKGQTQAAVARGETLEQARKSVNLEEFRKLFAGDSRFLNFVFANYVTDSGVAAAYREATEAKKQ
jgi:glyoxylase-like metal-dependent hydrolase (beta-lactamase superfamily II)